uniref:TBC1 domain family member 5 n=1 Tax=Anthurium amnicola TaxID=1678845 RepID=A0A1D1YYV6_9ARAE
MAAAATDAVLSQPSSPSSPVGEPGAAPSRFSNLRGVQWRMDLGILPSSPDASIDDLRRVAADSRRRYASLRRRLLIAPHIYKDGNKSPGLVMDDPLSQNPDSMWGRFFQNAELEKLVEQDLSRLYPEHGSYFQTTTCQAMLRRILLLWCLRYPEYGYRQGMHELLAPLLYVLQIDVQHLSQVWQLCEDQFSDGFDGRIFPETGGLSNGRIIKSTGDGETEEESFEGDVSKVHGWDEHDPETRNIILLSDAYGAEGELGIVLSERFMEHDAYCMFDALMNGAHGVVAVADFFSLSPASGSSTGLTPVIEASSAVYHLLSVVDSPLYNHLVELEIEPQYFALRWLRVLFGREFLLQDLLVLWDEIFSCPNSMSHLGTENEAHFNFRVLCSPRGAFISAMAVSMILHLRSSLLATENATTCLQRLLNFPKNMSLKILIDKAKSLQAIVVDANISTLLGAVSCRNKSAHIRGYSLPADSFSPETSLYSMPESYWEEKWRVLHSTEQLRKERQTEPIAESILNKTFNRGRFTLSRTESDPSPAKIVGVKNDGHSTVRRRLLDALSQEEYSRVDNVELGCGGICDLSGAKDSPSVETGMDKNFSETLVQNTLEKNLGYLVEEACSSGENSSVFSAMASPPIVTYHHENDSEKSSVTSNSCTGDNDDEVNPAENSFDNSSSNFVPRDSNANSTSIFNHGPDMDVKEKRSPVVKEKKLFSGKFQWFWKFGRGASEGNVEKGNVEAHRSTGLGNIQEDISDASLVSRGSISEPEVGDKKGTLRSLGPSMLENIQVLESFFQQDQGQAASAENLPNNLLREKGQVTAISALKELREISNLLSEM